MKIIPFIPSRCRYDFKCQQLSNYDVIDMRAASYCDVTLIYYSDTISMVAFIITMALPARAFLHSDSSSWLSQDLSLCGRIEIDHSYGLRCRGLCCHSRHSTRGAGRRGRKRPRNGRPYSCWAGSGSTNHSSADRIMVNSYNHHWFR